LEKLTSGVSVTPSNPTITQTSYGILVDR